MTIDIKLHRKLDAEATPGEWDHPGLGDIKCYSEHHEIYQSLLQGNWCGDGYVRGESDAELIALMRNDHVAMLDLIEAQAAEIEQLKTAYCEQTGTTCVCGVYTATVRLPFW